MPAVLFRPGHADPALLAHGAAEIAVEFAAGESHQVLVLLDERAHFLADFAGFGWHLHRIEAECRCGHWRFLLILAFHQPNTVMARLSRAIVINKRERVMARSGRAMTRLLPRSVTSDACVKPGGREIDSSPDTSWPLPEPAIFSGTCPDRWPARGPPMTSKRQYVILFAGWCQTP